MRPLIERLADARDHARRAAGYVSRLSLDAYVADATRRDAVCFCLIVVGEACAEATKELQEAPSDIPWTAIKGMRNLLIHEYWQIDDTIVYNTARHDAAPLASQLEELIKRRV